ncbi:MAG: hypothetical protein KHZ25_27215 [Klebsiella oxytoca]|nr:hypothetical protein [Klebsiella oxytoca]
MTNNQLTEIPVTDDEILRVLDAFDYRTGIESHEEHIVRCALAELQERRKAERDSEPVVYASEETLAYAAHGELLLRVLSQPAGDAIIPLYRHAQQPVVPEGLNPETTDLVLRFASALADKLYKAEQKYGRSTDWMKDDWYDDCLQSLWDHIEKGDPRDVAAYCAFMWYHGWVTTDYDRNVQNACRAAMLNGGKS